MRLRARLLIPEAPDRVRFVQDGVVELHGGVLGYVGENDGGPIDEDLRPGVLMPGFIDGHLHFAQTRIMGRASGALLDWLKNTTFPEEARFEDQTFARRVAEDFCRSVARAGTTYALVYGPVFPQAVATLFEVAERRGQRFCAGPVWMDEDCPDALKMPADVMVPAMAALVEAWHGKSGHSVAVAPRFALSCSRDLLAAAGRFANDSNLLVTTHLAENPVECQVAVTRFEAEDYLAIYEHAGLVKPGSVFAHCVYLSGAAWDRFSEAGAVVAHCPDSNDFLGSGSMPVGEVLGRHLPVAIGSDVAAGRSFRIPRILASAYDNGLRDGTVLSTAQLLWWGTTGGAAAIGMHDHGLFMGARADMVLFDPPTPAETLDEVIAALLFDHDAPVMRRTWVGGDVVWDVRRPGVSVPMRL